KGCGNDQNEEAPRSTAGRTSPPTMQGESSSGHLSSGCEILDGFGGQRLTADAPIAARDFGNLDPGDAAHALAFDRHHGVRELADHLALLLGIEHVLDDVNLYQRHVVLLDACLAEAGSINMPETAGADFQTAMICRPVQLEISPRSYCRPARRNPSR